MWTEVISWAAKAGDRSISSVSSGNVGMWWQAGNGPIRFGEALGEGLMSNQQIAEDYATAWSSGDPNAVVGFYREDGAITINRGDPIVGRAALLDMVSGFNAGFPDLVVRLDHLRVAGNHVMFGWTLEGTHADTNNRVVVPGWEEWDLDDDLKVRASLGWFDAVEYDRQIREGIRPSH